MTGVIVRVIVDKNFGFIRGEDGKEYFFHKSELVNETSFSKSLENRSVTFEDGTATKGPRAEQVFLD